MGTHITDDGGLHAGRSEFVSKSPTEDFGAPRVRAVGAKARDIRRYLEEAQRRARARAARKPTEGSCHAQIL